MFDFFCREQFPEVWLLSLEPDDAVLITGARALHSGSRRLYKASFWNKM
jgi:hypothetical protein